MRFLVAALLVLLAAGTVMGVIHGASVECGSLLAAGIVSVALTGWLKNPVVGLVLAVAAVIALVVFLILAFNDLPARSAVPATDLFLRRTGGMICSLLLGMLATYLVYGRHAEG
jgi:hypothetical protein